MVGEQGRVCEARRIPMRVGRRMQQRVRLAFGTRDCCCHFCCGTTAVAPSLGCAHGLERTGSVPLGPRQLYGKLGSANGCSTCRWNRCSAEGVRTELARCVSGPATLSLGKRALSDLCARDRRGSGVTPRLPLENRERRGSPLPTHTGVNAVMADTRVRRMPTSGGAARGPTRTAACT